MLILLVAMLPNGVSSRAHGCAEGLGFACRWPSSSRGAITASDIFRTPTAVCGAAPPPSAILSPFLLRKKPPTSSTSCFLSPRFVLEHEIWMCWRFQMKVSLPPGSIPTSYEAFVQLEEDNRATIYFQGQGYNSRYTFRPKSWPYYCGIEFEAPIFGQRGGVTFRFRGEFRRENNEAFTPPLVGEIALVDRQKSTCITRIGFFDARGRHVDCARAAAAAWGRSGNPNPRT